MSAITSPAMGDKLDRENPGLNGGNSSDGTSANPYNQSYAGINTSDLERLNTLSTILGPDAGTLSVEPHKRFRNFGNPSPLGLCAFALTTMVLSLVNVRARHLGNPNIVIGLALFYGGLCQLLSGMVCFLRDFVLSMLTLHSGNLPWATHSVQPHFPHMAASGCPLESSSFHSSTSKSPTMRDSLMPLVFI